MSSLSSASSISGSQSYLIGIERRCPSAFPARSHGLSIVPYWNWKYGTSCICEPAAALNRTLLELKERIDAHLAVPLRISQSYIVPYWNWKVFFLVRLAGIVSSQSYLIGIESPSLIASGGASKSSQSYLIGIESCDGRTDTPRLMYSQSYLIGIERILSRLRLSHFLLSIVPYWNWKIAGEALPESLPETLNRTLLELKERLRRSLGGDVLLSIVPYWNWKLLERNHMRRLAGSQSYLIGIESNLRHESPQRVAFSQSYLRDSQSYLIGIESSNRGRIGRDVHLSIVPYWNWKDIELPILIHRPALNRTLLELKEAE